MKLLRTALLRPAWWAWPLAVCLTALGARFHVGAPSETRAALVGYYLPSLLLMGLGCLPSFARAARRPPARSDSVLPRKLLVAATLAVLGLSSVVRVAGLGTWPPPSGSAFEEAQLGQQAKLLLDEGALPREHVLAISAPALSFRLFGASLTTLRLPFVILGVLAPWFLFALCRRLVAWEVALFALALFAVSWWSVTGSRIADEIFLPATLVPLVLLGLVDFYETASPASAFALALFSGVLIYEYTGYHIAPVLVLAYLLATVAVRLIAVLRASPRPSLPDGLLPALRRWGPGLFVVLMVWINLAMCQVVSDLVLGGRYFIEGFVRHQDAGCGLAGVDSQGLWAYVSDRLASVAWTAFSPAGGAAVPVVGLAGHPLFDPATALALGIGVVAVVLTPLRRFHALVLVWLAATVAVAALVPCTVNPHRLYTALPLAYLAIALGAQVLWDLAKRPRARGAVLIAFGIAVSSAARDNLGHLWNGFLHGSGTLAAFDEPSTRFSLWLSRREPDSLTWVLSERYQHLGQPNDYHWLLDGRKALTADSIPAAIPSPETPIGALYYLSIARPGQPGLEDLIRRYYPSVERLDTSEIAAPDADVQAFRIGPESRTRASTGIGSPTTGFLASYYSSRSAGHTGIQALPSDARLLLERREPFLSVLSIPLGLKKRFAEEATRGDFLWCSWQGHFEAELTAAAPFGLYVHGGEAWVSVNGGPVVHASAGQDQERWEPFTASLTRGANAFWLLYRLGPWEIVGAQLVRTLPDGRETVLAAPFEGPTPTVTEGGARTSSSSPPGP